MDGAKGATMPAALEPLGKDDVHAAIFQDFSLHAPVVAELSTEIRASRIRDTIEVSGSPK